VKSTVLFTWTLYRVVKLVKDFYPSTNGCHRQITVALLAVDLGYE
jgi:hypothetical protein